LVWWLDRIGVLGNNGCSAMRACTPSQMVDEMDDVRGEGV
jgi:hypothetical protein